MKKSLISIAALGFLSIPALASSATIQGAGQIIGPILSHEIDVIVDTLSQRKLVADDFTPISPLIKAFVADQDLRDPARVADHAVVSEQWDALKGMGVQEGPYILIIDDFGDFRQTLIFTGLITRINEYRAKALGGGSASIQPIRDAIVERRLSVLPADPRSAADATAATDVAEELAKRVAGIPTKVRKADFNFLMEVVQGQRLRQFTGITMARREGSGRVSPVDFKHARNLISARNAAELQLYRDAGVEQQRLNKSVADVQAAAMQAGTSPAPFRWLVAVSADLDLRRAMSFLQRKAMNGGQTVTQFNRLRALMVIRSQGPIGRSALGRDLSKAINAEIVRLEQVGNKRQLVVEDFETMERLRRQLLTNVAEASFK